MLDVTVMEEPAAAEAPPDPIRSRIPATLTEPVRPPCRPAAVPRHNVNYRRWNAK